MPITSEPAETTPGTSQIEAPASSASEEAEIRKLLVEQGAIKEDGGAVEAAAAEETDADPAAEPAKEGVFDDPEEAAAAAEMAAEAGEAPGEEAPAEEAKEPQAKAEEDPNSPSIARGLQSLARKENQLAQREKVISQREKEVAAKLDAADARLKLAFEDPFTFYKENGIDPADIAATMYFQAHPQGAPPEVLAKTQTIKMQREIEKMKAERAREQQTVAQQQVRLGALNYLTSVARTIPDELPYLKAEAAADVNNTAMAMLSRLEQLRESGQLDDVVGDDEQIAAKVARSLNADIERNVQRIKKLHLKAGNGTPEEKKTTAQAVAPKTPAPAAGEKKTAPKTITKKATAVTRPPRETHSHQDDIDKTIAAIKAGTLTV